MDYESNTEMKKTNIATQSLINSSRSSAAIVYTLEGQRYQVPRRCRQFVINGSIRNIWLSTIPNEYNEITSEQSIRPANEYQKVHKHTISCKKSGQQRKLQSSCKAADKRSHRHRKGNMVEQEATKNTADYSATLPRVQRGHTCVVTRDRTAHTEEYRRRPSTVIVTKSSQPITVDITVTRPITTRKNTSAHHQTKWNNSLKVQTPLSHYKPAPPRPVTQQSSKSLSSSPINCIESKQLSDHFDCEKFEELAPCHNRAVEKAFNKAINYRDVNSDRLRLGLITNDITPRVYLQTTEGSRHFKKMNMKLRDQLSDMFNYRCMDSLPSSPQSNSTGRDSVASEQLT